MAKLLYANTHDANMLYAVGVDVPDPFYYIDTGSQKYVFLDSREYGVFLDKSTRTDIEPVLLNPLFPKVDAMDIEVNDTGYGGRGHKLGLYLLKEYGLLDQEVHVPANFPIALADFLRSQGATIVVKSPIFPERLVKTAEEVAAIRESLVRTQAGFDLIQQVLADSTIDGDTLKYNGEVLTSEWLRQLVNVEYAKRDMLSTDGMIISCGAHAAIPHHTGAGPLRPHQTIICDIFPRHTDSGFYADMTRTFVKGEPTEYMQQMYAAVLDAQQSAEAAVASGKTGAEVHQVSVQTFEDRGFVTGPDSGFMHGTGHGLGLDIHEGPYVSSGADTPLAPGHVVTIEPGLYYPEHGGVRIEDVVVVTENGAENLTQYNKVDYIIA